MNITFGHVLPDEGQVFVRGEEVQIRSPRDALAHGIGMVHQHFTLVPNLSVAVNVALGSEPAFRPFNRGAVIRRVQETAASFGMNVQAKALVQDLSVDLQQQVEILKALYRGATTLILDEPTSLLGPAETENLFRILRDFRSKELSVVLVTHKLAEVMEIADRVTVLRRGEVVTESVAGEFDEQSLAVAMTGHTVREVRLHGEAIDDSVTPPLVVSSLTVAPRGRQRAPIINNVSIEVRRGEIVGIAGVQGNGQTELVEAIVGLTPVAAGSVVIAGTDVTDLDIMARRDAGLGVVPRDRHGYGLALDMTLSENLALSKLGRRKVRSRRLIDWTILNEEAAVLLRAFDVRPPDPVSKAVSLSGGNQQKVVLAREISADPIVLVADNPTWGLDVGAAAFVHQQLRDLRERGGAILLLSLDLDELFLVSDRLLVMYRGRIVLDEAVDDLDGDVLALAMAGRHGT
jgi:simple sugar transport system ATP-binding protein